MQLIRPSTYNDLFKTSHEHMNTEKQKIIIVKVGDSKKGGLGSKFSNF